MKYIVAFDFGQIEARVIEMFARDPTYGKMLWDKYDVHSEWTDQIAATYPQWIPGKLSLFKSDKPLYKKFRDKTKNEWTFPAFFGAQLNSISGYLGIPEEVLKPLFTKFWKIFSGVKTWHEETYKEFDEKGYVTYLTGRRRHAPLSRNQQINCCDTLTECLSYKGWKNVDELSVGELIFTRHPMTGNLELKPLLAITRGNYKGKVRHSFGSISSLTTPNHRWLVGNRYWKDYNIIVPKFKESQKLCEYNGGGDLIYLTANQWRGNNRNVNIWTDNEVSLIGWILTDGYYIGGSKRSRKGIPSGIQIGQSLKANPHKVKIIDQLILNQNIKVNRKVENNGTYIEWHFYDSLGVRIKEIMPEKILTSQFLMQLTQKQLNLLYESMLLGDGVFTYISTTNREKTFTDITIGKEKAADMFSYLCVLLGKSHNLKWIDLVNSPLKKYDSMPNIPISKGVWSIHFKNRYFAHPGFNVEWKDWEGEVWCPTTANGTFFARRNGKVYVTGNSPVQGSTCDIVSDAMNRLSEMEMDEYQASIQIHDDLTFVLEEQDLEDASEYIIKEMIRPVYPFICVPLVVEMSVGKNWGDMEPVGEFFSNEILGLPKREEIFV